MRICFVSLNYPSETSCSGVGTLTQSLARALAAKGHDIIVVAFADSNDPGVYSDGGVRVYRFLEATRHRRFIKLPVLWRLSEPIREIERSFDCWNIVRTLAKHRPFDVIETTESAAFFVSLMAPRTPLVTRLHGDPYTFVKHTPNLPLDAGLRLSRLLQRVAMRRAKLLLSPCRSHAIEIGQELGLPSTGGRISVIPHGVHFACSADDHCLTALGAAPKATRPVVLFVGRLEKAKGVLLLLAAARRVLNEMPSVLFAFAGAYHHSLPRSTLESHIDQLGIKESVSLLGHVRSDQLPALYKAAHVCVLPSYYESFGLSALEAMAHGRALVATRAGALPELIEDRRTGLLVPPGDEQALSHAIIELLKNEALRERLGETGKRAVSHRFTVDAMASLTLEAYRRVLSTN